jgi:ABC-2 type transport system ATP-binding protein
MQEMCDTVCIINNGRILRTGRVDELTHDAARGLYRYRLRPMDKAVALLRENAADRISEIGEDYVDLHVSEDEIEILNRRLVENGITIYGMSPVETSLEQIFMEITGGGNVVD